MTADGEDHISPTNPIAWVNQVKVNTTPPSSSFMWSPTLHHWTCRWQQGERRRPQIFREYLTDAQRSFLSPIDSFSLPNRADVREPETQSLLPRGPTWGLTSPVSLHLYHQGLFVQKYDLQVPYSIDMVLFWLMTSAYHCITAQWSHKQVVWENM